MKQRKAQLRRKTKEVDVKIKLNIDGEGNPRIKSGIPFLDHMLSLFAKHGVFDLDITAKGDLEIDIHHTNEDVAISLGQAFLKALGKKEKIRRFGWAYVCMDEALVRCVVDLSGRPFLVVKPARIKVVESAEYTYAHFKHFLKAFFDNLKANIHLDIIAGEDSHHILEAAFKALGLALDSAVIIDKRKKGLPTTKGKI